MRISRNFGMLATMAAGLLTANFAFCGDWEEYLEPPPWRASVNFGGIVFEGDEPVEDGFVGALRIGYDYSPRWTIEGVLSYAPRLKDRKVHDWYPARKRRGGLASDTTAAYGLAVDALYHLFFLDNRHWDPYLIGGLGVMHFTEERHSRYRTDATLRYGAGLAYHINQAWSVRADAVGVLTAHKTEFNLMPSVGLAWRWGDAMPPPAYEVVGAPELFTLYIEFETDKAVILPESFRDLDMIGETLYADENSTARIEGHADRRRKSCARYNQGLSERRAQAVAEYLSGNWGIAPERMKPVGYGFSRPLVPNDPVEGHPKNRRVEIYVFK